MQVATTAELLQLYVDAEAKILKGQSYRMGDRWVSRADLQFVQAERRRLQTQLNSELAASAGGRRRFSQANFGSSHDGSTGAEWNCG